MTINELRSKRANAWDTAKEFLDTHRDGNGMLSEEDSITYEKMEADIISIGHEIAMQERAEAIEEEISASRCSCEPNWEDLYNEKCGEVERCHKEIAEMRIVIRSLGALLAENHLIIC